MQQSTVACIRLGVLACCSFMQGEAHEHFLPHRRAQDLQVSTQVCTVVASLQAAASCVEGYKH